MFQSFNYFYIETILNNQFILHVHVRMCARARVCVCVCVYDILTLYYSKLFIYNICSNYNFALYKFIFNC